ncbi:cache domain-containing protein [Limisalsivibrio acetivorans]|uniref:cache domain-containing protein n=1 Tax=Limisalsivibrio acetivorans TaxID=1304888 RepID=UPI0003B32EF0|nr:cache domain-containing protein [Limisalsivibrio acetivorans]
MPFFRKLSTAVFFSFMISIFITLAAAGAFWINDIYRYFSFEADTLKSNYISSVKNRLRNSVQEISNIIEQNRSTVEEKSVSAVSKETDLASLMVKNLYSEFERSTTAQKLRRIALNNINSLISEKKREHWVIISSDGTILLDTNQRQNEGRSALSQKDSSGSFLYREMIEKSNNGGGIVKGYWGNRGMGTGMNHEIIYSITHLPELDWHIAAGIFTKSIEEEIKTDMLRNAASVRFGEDGYIFIVDYSGHILASRGVYFQEPVPREGTGGEDTGTIYRKAMSIVREKGSGFFEYQFPRIDTKDPEPKLSYVYGDNEWGWIIGTGAYTNDIDEYIASKEEELRQKVKMSFIKMSAVFSILFILLYLLSRVIYRKTEAGFSKFSEFFRRGRESYEHINPDELPYDEFRTLAEQANRMIDEKLSFENNLKDKQAELENEIRGRRNIQERLNTIFSTMEEGVLLQDSRGKILDVNKSFEQILRLNKKEILGKLPHELDFRIIFEDKSFCPPEEYPMNLARRKKKKISNHITGFVLAGSEIVWIQATSVPIIDEYGRLSRIVTTFADITESKELQDKFLKAQENMEMAQEVSHTGSWEMNLADGRFWVSDVFRKIFDLPEGELKVDDPMERIHPEDRDMVELKFDGAVKTGTPFSADYRVITRSGYERHVHGRIKADYKEGKARRVFGTVQDVTNIRKAQEQVKEAYEKLNEYVRIVDENVITSETDKDGNITSASEAFCRVSGYSKEELIGQNHRILRHDETEEGVYNELWETITKGNTWRGELRNKRKNGETYWVSAYVSPRYDKEGNVFGYISIRQDITDRKMVERLSVTDELTGVYNRRFFNKTIQEELRRMKREHGFLSFGMIDIDHFKQYNDTYGHKQGDTALRRVAEILDDMMQRGGDFAFRLGGEEFGILFSGQDGDKTRAFAERVKNAVEQAGIPHAKNSASDYLTISLGVVCVDLSGSDVNDTDTIYRIADEALYKAKSEGRNRVVLNVI